jgi:3-deoxy-manno-octulosonate cytidylyltransferase (CMP-KDO synthetase)
MAAFNVIIPARYDSTRLPGKPLRSLAGQPMIVHVLRRAERSGAGRVTVATDDARIVEAVRAAGGEAVLTKKEHVSGTDRVAEAAKQLGLAGDAIVVNVQGDEPLIDPCSIREVAEALATRSDVGLATLATTIREPADVASPHVVKVVTDRSGRALYFSRSPIPYDRSGGASWLRHVGLYAYRVSTLERLSAEGPVALERAESLEQLRALDLGIGIAVEVTERPLSHGVDTEEDLERAAEELGARALTEGHVVTHGDR